MKTNTTTLTAELLHKMDAYCRAANYLSVGQIYLYDNPLLKRPHCCTTRSRNGSVRFVAALGGLDTLVFAGGIGEKAPVVRARICDGPEFLGIELEEKRNAANAGVISTDASRATVRVMHTDEEWMIANTVCRVLGLAIEKEHDHENKKGV